MDLYTIDVETYYDKEYSLAKMSAEEYIADERFELISVSIKKNFEPTQCYFASKAEAAIQALPLAENAMLAHNARFDALVLSMRYGVEAAYYFDTMLMANALVRPFRGSSALWAVCETFKIPIDKKFITNMLGKRYADIWALQKDKLAEYNKADVEATYEAFKRLMYMAPIGQKGSKLRFPRSELDLIDLSIRMYLHPVIELDHELAAEHADKVEADREALRKEVKLDAAVLRSMQKTCEVLRGMGVDVPTRKKKEVDEDGNVEESEVETLKKTDPRVIALLSHEDERVRKVVQARLAYASNIEITRGRRLATLGERFNKLRVPLSYYGAHTGRFSGTDKLNLQNLSRTSALRKTLRAPKGHAVVAVDAAQIEARVLGWLAGQHDLLDQFAKGEDVYASMATDIFGYPVNKSEHPKERFVGKTCLGGDTQVLTDRGWVRLLDVRPTDRLWDGVEWITHSGICFSGLKKTISLAGLHVTPDHEILTGRSAEAWASAATCRKKSTVFRSALDTATLPSSVTHPQVTDGNSGFRSVVSLRPVFDIMNAGPRRRFTVWTDHGPIIVHNCVLGLGYGAGWVAFHNALYAQGYRPNDNETEDDVKQLARRSVDAYRARMSEIRRMWARAQKWLELFVSGQTKRFIYKHVEVDVRKDFSCIWLPNGMPLIYSRPTSGTIEDRTSYWFFRGKQREFTHGPKVCENIVQATARIIVTDVALEMKRRGWPIALTVHDDLIWVVPERHAQEVHDTAVELLSTPPSWAKGLPLAAEGKIAETYGG